MLKAVIFDVDGVLVDSKNANITMFKKLLVLAGYPEPTEQEILEGFHMPMRDSIQKLTGSTDDKEVERIWEMGKEITFRNSLNPLLTFPDKLEDILEQLNKQYRLAIVTSRIRIGMEAIFKLREIQHLFEVVIVYEDTDNHKPHPEPLMLALNQLGLQPQEAIYIGDGNSDIDAAQAAGMKSIHISLKAHKDAGAAVKEFNELTSAIKTLL